MQAKVLSGTECWWGCGEWGADNAQRGAGQPKTGLLLSRFITYNLFSIEERKSTEMCPHENGHQLISHPGRGEPRDPSPYALFHGLVWKSLPF